MANRILRDWTDSETIAQVSEGAELFFVHLIMKADDYGCFSGNPKLLKGALFPLRPHSEKQISVWRDELASAGVIQIYEVDGRLYVKIKNFNQRLRLMQPKYPQPESGKIHTPSNDGHLSDKCPPETKRSRNEEEEETKVAARLEFCGAELPFTSPAFGTAWIAWEAYRREKKQKITVSTAKLQIKLLARFDEATAIKMIYQSIEKGWTGIFEIKTNNENGLTKKERNTASLKESLANDLMREFGGG